MRAVFMSAAAMLVATLLSSCGGDGSPTSSSGATTPTPTPTDPVPKTPAPVGAVTCALGDGTEGGKCKTEASQHAAAVQLAIDDTLKTYPTVVQWEDAKQAYRVLDKLALFAGVLDELRAAGLCADLDYATLEVIQVKSANTSSEDFDIVDETGYLRRAEAAYAQTCKPASFPLPVGPDAPPPGLGCGRPFPPPITRFGAKIHVRFTYFWTLDSTPLTGPNGAYCRQIGYTDGRTICPVRVHGAWDREACEEWAVGNAKDTNQPGPTWTRDDLYCTGEESGCEHHEQSPFMLKVFGHGTGTYKVCAANGACGQVFVKR